VVPERAQGAVEPIARAGLTRGKDRIRTRAGQEKNGAWSMVVSWQQNCVPLEQVCRGPRSETTFVYEKLPGFRELGEQAGQRGTRKSGAIHKRFPSENETCLRQSICERRSKAGHVLIDSSFSVSNLNQSAPLASFLANYHVGES